MGAILETALLEILRCPSCRSPLEARTAGDAHWLVCGGCAREVPVKDGIPRFVDVPDDPLARHTQASFGYEWTHFNDWRQSGETNFNDYFAGLDLASLGGRMVLDAGCGMGRHARQIASHAGHVVAVDFSRAIDQARRNVASFNNVDCLQADLLALPLASSSFDLVYSLGVLHHLADTERALAGLVDKVRPGGRLRIYLYWKRHGWQGALLGLVTALRRLTVKMPFGLLRACCFCLAAVLYAMVILPYRLFSRLGMKWHRQFPLFVYTKYPFHVIFNDQFDRFSAPIEKRYDQDEVRTLLERAGLRDVQVRSCFGWVGDGTRPV
jgi:SAM-dependent methyltransferase